MDFRVVGRCKTSSFGAPLLFSFDTTVPGKGHQVNTMRNNGASLLFCIPGLLCPVAAPYALIDLQAWHTSQKLLSQAQWIRETLSSTPTGPQGCRCIPSSAFSVDDFFQD